MRSLLILASLQKEMSSLEVYSPPLSDLITFIFSSVRFSTSALNYWNLPNTSSLVFNKYNHVFLEKSSINVT
jgi:hypothetical protein